MIEKHLSKQQVSEVVYTYKSGDVTKQLYEFGKMMLDEINDRGGRLNSQASTMMGWDVAIIAFLFTQMPQFNGRTSYFGLASAVLALASLIFAFQVSRTRQWLWPSDTSWIHASALGSEDELKRYHIRVFHDVLSNHSSIVESKATCLSWSETFLTLSAVALFVGIGSNVLLARFPGILTFS